MGCSSSIIIIIFFGAQSFKFIGAIGESGVLS